MEYLLSAVRYLRNRDRQARTERAQHSARVRDEVVRIVRTHLQQGQRAWLIGSLACGEFHPSSDIDLVVDGVDAETALRIELAVARAADVEVDMLDFRVLPESFKRRILSQGISLE